MQDTLTATVVLGNCDNIDTPDLPKYLLTNRKETSVCLLEK